ncbi:hypothetical protein GKZ89_20630 [Bacillus mangrovi]|uniref:Putative sugar diacid recognition domain-containing protein n=1 Tax=Metabacillus mangrovi TaxID=1491830 RepID=A0A7X2V7H3_9BACI|nr:sugar diacid recognition domain-containing protein [Metabacillus mangrovi]MTH55798.1 hypothetical protein [Metabacillus mangrovi]
MNKDVVIDDEPAYREDCRSHNQPDEEDHSCNINIMNREGMIIASGEKEHLHSIHEGARLVIQAIGELI